MDTTRVELDATFARSRTRRRRAILARLAPGDASVAELAEPFDMTQPRSRSTSECSSASG